MATRRAVTLCKWTVQRHADQDDRGRIIGVGRSGQLFAFSWRDLSVLFGVQVETAQRMARSGKFDPRDLGSVVELYNERRQAVAK